MAGASTSPQLEYRALAGAHELPAWYDLCAAAFAAKGTPREYFVKHYERDPSATPEAVFVCEAPGHGFVSTVRVFRRVVRVQGRAVLAGGIGEVCTLPEWRRQGISTRLLAAAVAFMRAQGFAASTLHSSDPRTAAFYARQGWQRVPLRRRSRPLSAAALAALQARGASAESRAACTELPHPSATAGVVSATETLAALAELHADFNSRSRLSGWFERTESYWRRWVVPAAAEADTCFALATRGGGAADCPAYLCLRLSGETLYVQDVAYREGAAGELSLLLAFAISQLLGRQRAHSTDQADLQLVALEALTAVLPLEGAGEGELVVDSGQMYRVLDAAPFFGPDAAGGSGSQSGRGSGSGESESTGGDLPTALHGADEAPSRHVFWGIDAF